MALALLGLIFLYSATYGSSEAGPCVTRQAVALCVGVLGMSFLAIFPYHVWQTYAKGVYGVGIFLLIAVLAFGTRLRGSKSWFDFQFFFFQPVEVSRLALAVALAAYADFRCREIAHWKTSLGFSMIAGIPLGLVLLQPDLSSVLVLGPMLLSVLCVAGAPVSLLLGIAGIGFLALGIPLTSTYILLIGKKGEGFSWIQRVFTERAAFFQLWAGVCGGLTLCWWFLRKWRVPIPGAYLVGALAVVCVGVIGSSVVKDTIRPYQQKRLIAFVDPAIDPLDAGYNIRQSKIAVGSGRLWGTGYLSGSQTQLGFLPEKKTDFIFSLAAEEMGFLRTFVVLALYFFLVWRAFDIAGLARDLFGRFLAVALGTFFGFSGIVNIGMGMGLMPVTGIPLPFLSYGGSALVGSFLAVGLLLSIHLRRHNL
jgi:rod shape determining protein RodA